MSHAANPIKNDSIPALIAERQRILEETRASLREEFIGIDGPIDELITYVRPWFLFPQLQERPVVISLWGMTGVGKTSVVARLVELLSCQNRFFRFDLGDKESSFSFYESVSELSKMDAEMPLIVGLDEFQHTRTVDEQGCERDSDRNRMIWDLMDSGKIRSYGWDRQVDRLDELRRRLEGLLAKGVRVEKGRIISGVRNAWRDLELHGSFEENEELSEEDEKKGRAPRFVSERHFEEILDVAGQKLGLHLKIDLEERLSQMDGDETLAFLKQVVKIGMTPKEKRYSRLLVIVMGNLDEAFHMAGDFSADVDADFFFRRSRKIGITQIKAALKGRFRLEQIARLGNVHIIYPGISRDSYERVIARELDKISRGVLTKLGLRIEFDASINRLIYQEGVFPTQGFRPIFSTLHQLISGNLGLFLSFPEVWNQGIDCLQLCECDRRLRCTFLSAGVERFSASQLIPTPLTNKRKPRLDDQQAVTAVHESGHAILAMTLLSMLPETVASVTSDHDSGGFVVRGPGRTYLSRDEILPEAAVYLGGYAAEKLLFGTERMTVGSRDDILSATDFISRMIKHCGMGSIVAGFSLAEAQQDHALHQPEIEAEVRAQLAAALAMAEETLNRERRLLLKLADHLSDHSKMTRQNLAEFMRRHARGELIDRIENLQAGTGHRFLLKQLVEDSEGAGDVAQATIVNLEENRVASGE